MKHTERIDTKRAEKFLKFFLILSVLAFITAVLKVLFKPEILTGKGSLTDYLFSLSPLLFYLEYYRKSKKLKGQFIEWSDSSVTFKTRDQDTTSITYSSIRTIEINLDCILIYSKSGALHKISLEDFTEYQDRIRIKENFSRIPILI